MKEQLEKAMLIIKGEIVCDDVDEIRVAKDLAVQAIQEQLESDENMEWIIDEYEYFTCSYCGYFRWSSCESTSEAKEKIKNGDTPAYCENCGRKKKGKYEKY